MFFHRVSVVRCSVTTIFCLSVLVVVLSFLRFVVLPIATSLFPSLFTTFYDLGLYGYYPTRSFYTSPFTPPLSSRAKWDAVCNAENEVGGLVLGELHGSAVRHKGPIITDLKGNLIWFDDTYESASNLKVQTWKGKQYLTFWAGSRAEGSGQGQYYMLDDHFNLAKTVAAVGDGLYGDIHEFKITADDTALMTVYQRNEMDLSGISNTRVSGPILDSIIQEVDIDTGRLVFKWRASDSDHLGNGYYLKTSHGELADDTDAYDYFHLNSIEKTLAGDYLISVRHMHLIVLVSGKTGDILWGFGGASIDFQDLSDGRASDFMWQHDVRWIDEKRGILSLFNNGAAKDHHHDSPYSEGKIIHLDVEIRTAQLLHSYASLQKTQSTSQGSLQYLPATNTNGSHQFSHDRAFVGWGASAAWSLFYAESEMLLCETHFAPSLFFFFEFAKSYRSTRAPPDWKARPTWHPVAAIKSNNIYVSWNGGMEVKWWALQRARASAGSDVEIKPEDWEDVEVVQKNGFETRIKLPATAADALYRIAALDKEREPIRHSNVVHYSVRSRSWAYCTLALLGLVVAAALFVSQYRNQHWRLSPLLALFADGRRGRYTKVEDDPIELDEVG
ncbi:hypothetical protein LTR37_020265 [Vermiconidia calcicola]|uniref:Uncharacterized protein n=1 Tax=Vermiconidia calcicola TaxID=1690605 RepID=A0ACC3MBX7_9PEZI|nr:hypothetical protein LTR37_020265 [Vermiconidia calcicola]